MLFTLHTFYILPFPTEHIINTTGAFIFSGGLLTVATRPHKLMTLVASLSGCQGQLSSSYDGVHNLQFPPMIIVSEGLREDHLLFFSVSLSPLFLPSPLFSPSSNGCNSHRQAQREASAPPSKEKQTRMMTVEVK